ncbi:MAG: Trp biosynthesis-associated membrane protein [Microbacterium sp.]|uniref:Trp biosynthesis-associated membrane protein n=1 Tax=Microbacterium sp. TaxID=51671 RepID=UPI0039E2EDF6
MTRRPRLLAVVATLSAGALGIVASTQTWLDVALKAGGDALSVAGAAAIPVLAPLCLATLALGAALSIVGTALRYVFGALSTAIAIALAAVTAPVAFQHPVSAVAAEVTKATGIAGDASVTALVAAITPTPWPVVSLALWVVLFAAGVFTLATARAWQRAGRRYDAGGEHAKAADDTPLDAIDSWDELSRGQDPTG